MDLDLINSIIGRKKENNEIQDFTKELQNYLEENLEKDNRLTTKYRDKFNLERNTILINYANETEDKGQMYYIYDKSSRDQDSYNLSICEEKKSHTVITLSKMELPQGAKIGSVLRKENETFKLDEEATKEVSEKINKLERNIAQEQNEYLQSKRIEGHIYEISEKSDDRVWLFDNTDEWVQEALEEIEFPQELLITAQEGDLFIYQKGEYQKYRPIENRS